MDTKEAGRLGGRKHSASLTPEQRRKRASKAAKAMHAKRKAAIKSENAA